MKFNSKSCVLLAALGLLAAAPNARAADARGAYAIDGGGGAPCKAFTESRRAASGRANDLFAGWVDGYVSAANRSRPETFDLTPWQTTELLLLLLSRYCENYPEDRFQIAVDNLLDTLHPQRLVNYSDRLVVGEKAQGISIYREVLKRAQRSLASQGFYTGQMDGNYDKAVHKAFRDYQEKNGLKATGLPEPETLYRLLPLSEDKADGKKPASKTQ